MMNQTRSFLFVVIILVLLLVFKFGYSVLSPEKYRIADSFESVPEKVGNYVFRQDIVMDDLTMKALDPDVFVFREYIDPEGGDSITVVIVYHRDERWGAHTPEGCYSSQGWKVIENEPSYRLSENDVEIDVNRLIIEGFGSRELVYYWYFDDSIQTSRRIRQWFVQMGKQILKKGTGFGMVRISKVLNDEDDIKELNRFSVSMSRMIPSLFKRKKR